MSKSVSQLIASTFNNRGNVVSVEIGGNPVTIHEFAKQQEALVFHEKGPEGWVYMFRDYSFVYVSDKNLWFACPDNNQ